MYRAKELGRDNFQFYTPEQNVKVHEKFLLQEELRKALRREEFLLLYQPQVDLRQKAIEEGKLKGNESLPAHMTLSVGNLELNVKFDGEARLE